MVVYCNQWFLHILGTVEGVGGEASESPYREDCRREREREIPYTCDAPVIKC